MTLDDMRVLSKVLSACVDADLFLTQSAAKPSDASFCGGCVATESGAILAASLERHKTSCRNMALGGCDEKAAALGTVASAPSIDVKALVDLGLSEKAAGDYVAIRDALRSGLMGLVA